MGLVEYPPGGDDIQPAAVLLFASQPVPKNVVGWIELVYHDCGAAATGEETPRVLAWLRGFSGVWPRIRRKRRGFAMREDWEGAWTYRGEVGDVCIEELKIILTSDRGNVEIKPDRYSPRESSSCPEDILSGTLAVADEFIGYEVTAVLPLCLPLDELLTLRDVLRKAMAGTPEPVCIQVCQNIGTIEVLPPCDEHEEYMVRVRWLSKEWDSEESPGGGFLYDPPYCQFEVCRSLDDGCFEDVVGALKTLERVLRMA